MPCPAGLAGDRAAGRGLSRAPTRARRRVAEGHPHPILQAGLVQRFDDPTLAHHRGREQRRDAHPVGAAFGGGSDKARVIAPNENIPACIAQIPSAPRLERIEVSTPKYGGC